jgi:glucosamine kinase
MSLILGIDSGGTKTLAAVAQRDGTVVGLIRGESLDPIAAPDWRERLRALIGRLGHQPRELAAAALGLPFHGETVEHSAEQERVVADLLPIGAVVVDNDVRIAFDGALAGQAGALILAGTGSMAWASLNGPGDPHLRAGGWGDIFGDEGSAYWIGRESLAQAAREIDGRAPASRFSQRLLEAHGLGPEGLIGWCYGLANRRSGVADLARLVAELGAEGDPSAIEILQRAGDELAETLLAAWRKAAGDRPLRWSYAGGVTTNPLVLSRIEARVGCPPEPCRLPPVGGALLRAAQAAGWTITEAWLRQIDRSLRASPAIREVAIGE